MTIERTLWMTEKGKVYFIDQNKLPFTYSVVQVDNYEELVRAIKDMNIRGAGAIGVAGGFAMALAFFRYEQDKTKTLYIDEARRKIMTARPTAYNLQYAVEKVYQAGIRSGYLEAFAEAQRIAEEDISMSKSIAEYGLTLIHDNFRILTHCNAGSLAFVHYGTALAPIYLAAEKGMRVHVYVSETRPRLQGARLTAWELQKANIPFTIISDAASAYLMQQKQIDMVIVGADRIARNGDTANKIGTLEKAIVAHYYNIPFYVAAPSSTFDLNCPDGSHIPIEYRSEDEVLFVEGLTERNERQQCSITFRGANALNPAFDVTPAHLITAIITEKGIIRATEKEILRIIRR